jgi:hypothetical protein
MTKAAGGMQKGWQRTLAAPPSPPLIPLTRLNWKPVLKGAWELPCLQVSHTSQEGQRVDLEGLTEQPTRGDGRMGDSRRENQAKIQS